MRTTREFVGANPDPGIAFYRREGGQPRSAAATRATRLSEGMR